MPCKDPEDRRRWRKEWYARNREQKRIADARPEFRQRRREYAKTEQGREAMRRAHKKYVAANRNKRNAHNAVQYALRIGRLVRGPCESCGAAEVEAHHDNYSKPLEVRWLCKVCHELRHHGPLKDLA